jgi:hypothetical protein
VLELRDELDGPFHVVEFLLQYCDVDRYALGEAPLAHVQVADGFILFSYYGFVLSVSL